MDDDDDQMRVDAGKPVSIDSVAHADVRQPGDDFLIDLAAIRDRFPEAGPDVVFLRPVFDVTHVAGQIGVPPAAVGIARNVVFFRHAILIGRAGASSQSHPP